MEYTHVNEDHRSEVMLRGQFTFFDTTLFTKVREIFTTPGTELVVLNFRDVDFIDSAALGMLLLAREEAEAKNVRLVLAHPSRAVEKAFKISAFETLFEMHE